MCIRDRSGPGVDIRTPWPALSDEQQREMDQAVAMLREAADQGHMAAQACCGAIYDFGCGVAKDERLAFVYYEKSAQQGHLLCEFNTGLNYEDGLGCDPSYERAAEWYEKAASRGHVKAQVNLAILHGAGLGVPTNLKKARDLYTLAAEQGHADAAEGLELINKAYKAIQHEYPLLGKRVVITGTSREDLNGKTGVATSFDHARGRYVVEFGKQREKAVAFRPQHLRSAG